MVMGVCDREGDDPEVGNIWLHKKNCMKVRSEKDLLLQVVILKWPE